MIESFKQKTEEKAKELTAYKQKHDIHFSHERPAGKSANNATDSATTATKKEPQESGVLVEKDT